jgi:hypothetical protein
LKQLLSITFLILTYHSGFAQKFTLKINGYTAKENKIIDSLLYTPKHPNLSLLESEIVLMSKKLEQIGYLDHLKNEMIKKNDSVYAVQFQLKEQIKKITLYIGDNLLLQQILHLSKNNDSLVLNYHATSNFLKETLKKAEELGYPLAKLQLTNIKRSQNKLFATLDLKTNTQKKVTQIIIKSEYDTAKNKLFPQNHLLQINKKYKEKVYNQKLLQEIQLEFDKFTFVRQTKSPALLLSQDSTLVYVYLAKRKANTFDGYIGIGNNEEKKTILNGYLNIQLQNMLNKGEDFFIYWKSDGNDQKTFRSGLTLDFLFKTPLGIKAQLNIFKQDSTFQNSKTLVDLHYLISLNTKVYFGVESTISSDIQNKRNAISDYKNQFITTGLNFIKKDSKNYFFPEKTIIELRLGNGKRSTSTSLLFPSNQRQTFISVTISHNFDLNRKNSINIRSQNYYLKSDSYLTNELFRFGGQYSIRGFAENSLQGNQFNALLTEYRYNVTPNLYINSILDYALFKDRSQKENPEKINNLNSLGLGIGIRTNNGILKISVTNGTNNYNNINFFNSIANISYNVKF